MEGGERERENRERRGRWKILVNVKNGIALIKKMIEPLEYFFSLAPVSKICQS
jgi:hypothetical protein